MRLEHAEPDEDRTSAPELSDEWAALFDQMCVVLRESTLSAVTAIGVSAVLYDGSDAAMGLWLLGKEVARRHGLGCSASLQGETLSVRFRQPGAATPVDSER
ncbi:MAG: hypothetical protein ACYC1C_11115 [Chloroflexota bacterium]